MEVQLLLLISFTLHNFYFKHLEIIFLIGKRELFLHTFFDICGGFVPSFVNKISPILDPSSFLQTCFIYLFLHFFEQLADCLAELFELSNNFDTSNHCCVNAIYFVLGRTGEFV